MIRRSMIVAALLASTALAAPAFAADTTQSSGKVAAPSAATQTDKRTAKQEAAGIEAHIAGLHKKLHITAAQQPQWDAFAQVMRDNNQQFSMLHKSRMEKMKAMNAVDDLKVYQEISQAHADGMKRLAGAFQTLYDSMSPEQKKNADTVFHDYKSNFGRKAAKGA